MYTEGKYGDRGTSTTKKEVNIQMQNVEHSDIIDLVLPQINDMENKKIK